MTDTKQALEDERATQVPLIELLLRVPKDARHIYDESPTHSHSIPIGRLCHEAAATLQLQAQVEHLRRPLSELEITGMVLTVRGTQQAAPPYLGHLIARAVERHHGIGIAHTCTNGEAA